MKKKVYFFLILAALFTFSKMSAQDITTGLKLHYTFDNVTDGMVPDASGNGLAGTFMGAAVTAEGHTGLAVNLVDVNDYVQLPTGVVDGVTDFTIALWVNVNDFQYWGRFFDFGSGSDINMFLCPTGGSPKFVIKKDATVGEQALSSSTPLIAGVWQHIAITGHYDENGNGTITMYINGAKSGVSTTFTSTPGSMGATTLNYIGKSQYADPTINGKIDDFRIYTRCLTEDDIMTMNGVPAKLVTAYKALAFTADLSSLTENLTLPATIGSDGVTISWTTSDSTVITNTGVITRPEKYKTSAKLIATLVYSEGGVVSTIKKVFNIIVAPIKDASEVVATWNFTDDKIATGTDGTISVTDESENAFIGTCKAGAQVVKIGKAEKINVLSIATEGQYFDFGTDIGEAVYGLTDYTVSLFFRKDTTDGTKAWSGNGQQLYGFSNSLALSTDANGAMYYEPNRGRHVCTPDNYGSEGNAYCGVGGTNTLLGTWHNITYSQTNKVGTLYYDGVKVATANAMPEPATTLKVAGRKGTLYNSLGRAFYTGDPQLSNTLIWGFNMFSVGLTTDDLESVLGIQSNIAKLDNAYNTMSCDLYLLMDMGNLLKTVAKYQALNYPGLADFNIAVAAAQKTYDDATVTQASIDALNVAIATYLKTQAASGKSPMNYTFAITNPSFEEGTGGTLDPRSYRDGSASGNGSYNYPKGWTVYLNHSGWCNAAFISDAPSDGVKCFETWAATINEFNVYQEVELKAGYYIQSAQIRTNAGVPYTQHIYAMTPDSVYSNSANLDSASVITGTGWNGLGNWQTLTNSFYCKGGKMIVGFRSNGFMQFDNMRLTYFGTDKPGKVDFTGKLANAGFEDGVTPGVDATSVKGAGGGYNTPTGWNAHCDLDPAAGWCNMVSISGTMSEGSKGFECWASSGYINEFNISQKIEAPATGYYKLTADVRCDGSSPSKTDTACIYDAHVYAIVDNFAQLNSKKLGENKSLITGDGWNSKTAWKTVSLVFKAGVGETINLGVQSSSFMQIDNVRLTYYAVTDPSQLTKVGYFTFKKTTMDLTVADSVQNDPVYRMLSTDPNLKVTLNVLTDVTATSPVVISGYDVLIIQESFDGAAKILTPAGPLGLAKLSVPTIFNKSYAFKAGRALATGMTGSGAEGPGAKTITVSAANQSNPLFTGMTFTGDSVALFNAFTTDLGVAGTATSIKALNYAKAVTGVDGTLLGYPTGVTDATISINDIPAGTTIGGQVTQTRIITMNQNFGAICYNHGANLTADNYKLWGNAVYVLANGLMVPSGGYTGIEQPTASSSAVSVDIYPNPTSNYLNIKGIDDMSTVRVFNALGKQVYSGLVEGNETSIDLSRCNQGLYILQVKSNGKTLTSKIIKK